MIGQKTEKPWFLYLIKTNKNSLYTGITTDVRRRFHEHQYTKKGAKALRGKCPLTLVFCAQVSTHSDALKAEAWIKAQNKYVKQALISGKTKLDYKHKLVDIKSITTK
ncbi:GIY-YIG nuclease family protein [Glaciecola sp. KUL10]|uniref:GIY-YIG nuclease family protein n=1 Tax=Glaciecola sp. (strain KUL10) TaxID=2161813 RepID=UPI000D788D84|nr:GIY-YIG nuclease family protein [Glaciecola sp. KUL10]GBL04263.1 GIY-YIG catalytic domain protein [Glaciecola sp. KUL10]